MTIVIAHLNTTRGYLFADSALTHTEMPILPLSSIGEIQRLEHETVEERMLKVLELPRNVLVAFVGDVDSAIEILVDVRDELSASPKRVSEILDLVALTASAARRVEFVFLSSEQGVPTLTVIAPRRPILRYSGPTRVTIALGSPSDFVKTFSMRAMMAADDICTPGGLSMDSSIAARLAMLQSLSVSHHLPAMRVGGLFYGAGIDSERIVWQPQDIHYSTYSPNLKTQPVIPFGVPAPASQPMSGSEDVYVSLRNHIAFIESSQGAGSIRMMTPALMPRSSEHWETKFKEYVSQGPIRRASAKHIIFLSLRDRKAACIVRMKPNEEGPAWLSIQGSESVLRIHLALVEQLEKRPPDGQFELFMSIDACDHAGDVTSHGGTLSLPLETRSLSPVTKATL